MVSKNLRVCLIGSDRLIDKIAKPLETADIECTVITKLNLNNIRKIIFNKYDIVIVDIAGIRILLGWINKILYRSILIYRARGNFLKELNKFKGFLVTIIIKNTCDAIIFASYYLLKQFIKNGITAKWMDVVKVPIYADEFKPKLHDRGKYFKVITLTNFDYYLKVKPLFEYLQVVDSVLNDICGKWHIAGKGKYVRYLEKAIKTCKNIQYIGYIDPRKHLQEFDVILYISGLDANLSNAALEGMATGLPVIVNDYEPLKIGPIIFVAKDEKELIHWIKKLHENPALRRKYGIMGQKYVKSKYNPSIISKKYIKVFKKILGNV